MYKLFVFSPDKEEVIYSIMEAASEAGAGVIGNYTRCGFYSKGTGNWKPETGAHPTIGKVGEYSHEPEVKIEMICPEEKVHAVKKAIKNVHPYEEPEIDFIELIDVE
jgi:hypothetical protein